MPASLTLRNQSFPAGTQTFLIDNLPTGANGTELTVERAADWLPEGHIFDFDAELSPDGETWYPYFSGSMDGGPAAIWRGVPVAEVSWRCTWPTIPEGTTPRILKGATIRLTLNAARAFTTPKVVFQGF